MLTLAVARQPAPILARGVMGVGLNGGPPVTVYTAGAAAGMLGATTAAGTSTAALGASVLAGTATATAGMTAGSMLAAAAIGGAVGSIASQGVAMAMGMQDSFSWKGVAAGAIGAGVASGVGAYATSGMSAAQIAATPVSWSQAALRAAGTSVVTQGVGSVLGVSSFSWKGVAAAAAGAGASTAMGSAGWMSGMNSVASGTVKGLVSGGIQAGIFETRPDWGSIAAQSFGSAVGDSFTQQKVAADAQQGTVGVSNDDSSKSGYYLTRDQEISLQEGRTRTDYGDDYADGDGVLASSVGGRRRAGQNRLELRGVSTEREDSLAQQRALRDLQPRLDTLESTGAQLQAVAAEMMKSSGASSQAVAGTGLTISTDFPFPAEQLPDGGFFRGLVAGQRSVLDAGQTSFAENVGAGVRGAVLSPINTVTGLLSEVGSQYKDMFNLLSGAGADYTPSSALVTSLQREGAGTTLLNMGAAALGAPVAPVFDLLEGRYEQAGAGLPGMLAAGMGVVRGVRLGNASAAPDFIGPMKPSNWDALTAHPDGHAFSVHGGGVTDAQLVVRARTGMKPDGSTGPIPPLSSAFHSDALLVSTDQAIRDGGGLANAIARQPGQSVVRVETVDVGDLGMDLGHGYVRLGATGNKAANAMGVGPVQRVGGLNSAQGIYEFNPATGVWETITVYPAPH